MFRRSGVVAAVAALLFSACGGGGGGSSDTPVESLAISGSIAVSEAALVDSDTNDVNQPSRSSNNSRAAAQPITSPLTLVGTVNEVNQGPEGATYFSGDEFDFFRVTLTAGQVVELEFGADSVAADLDLLLESTDGAHIGVSNVNNSRYECVTVNTTATYYVAVVATSGASIYNLRIGAPGSASSCPQGTQAVAFDPKQLLAQEKPQAAASAGLRRLAASSTDAGPVLVSVPATAELRLQALNSRVAASGLNKSLPSDATPTAAVREAIAARDTALSPALAAIQHAKALQATGRYTYVQPNWIMQRQAITGTFPPADRNYAYQRWHYEQINLPAAMARIDGLASKPVQRPVVAVIDDGVMLDHPDIQPQLFSSGRAFISDAADTGNRASGDNTARASDNPVFHGTHVAGTVAAATFEPTGGAGVAPMGLLMPLRVFSPAASGASSLDVIQAMRYAAGLSNNSGTLPARRADVINLSLGSDRSCDAAYQNVIAEVRAQGTVVVVAAGNSSRNDLSRPITVGSPANCPGAIAVGAVDAQKRLAFYSNTGNALGLVAPGGDSSQSTTGNGAPDAIYSDLGAFDGTGARRPSFGGLIGTSMAAPHVSGVIALMRYLNPALTPSQIDTLLASGTLTDDLGSAGKDTSFGWGLVNARKAVEAAIESTGNPVPEPPVQIVSSPSTIDFGSFQSTATFDLQAAGTTTETVTSVTSTSGAVTVTPVIGSNGGLGRYTITVDRGSLPEGSSFPQIIVTLSPSRTLIVQLSVTKLSGSTTGQRIGNYGPVYVLLVDPDTREVLRTVLAQRTSTGYTWTAYSFKPVRVAIIAGGDLDNDGIICQRGEPCGGYPVLSPTGDQDPVNVTGTRRDLNFQVAPLSSISALSTQGFQGFRRTPVVDGP